jgi:Protein of unknown function (DUF4038)
VETGKRYLVDAAGKPFFINGDSPWSLMVQLTREQADQYLEDRRLKGMNAVMAELIEHRKTLTAKPHSRRLETSPHPTSATLPMLTT